MAGFCFPPEQSFFKIFQFLFARSTTPKPLICQSLGKCCQSERRNLEEKVLPTPKNLIQVVTGKFVRCASAGLYEIEAMRNSVPRGGTD
jgi:hypothetical protein